MKKGYPYKTMVGVTVEEHRDKRRLERKKLATARKVSKENQKQRQIAFGFKARRGGSR